jgi:1-acyl-sn-glycerol-3-phosphate acyltransferase
MPFIKRTYLNLSFYTLFMAFSAVGIPALTLLVAVTSVLVSRRRTMRCFRRVISFYGKVVVLLAFPLVRVRHEFGSDIKPPGPYIFVSNHRSLSDPVLMSFVPVEAVQVVSVWPLKIPVLGFYARLAGYLSINTMPSEEFFSRANKLLKDRVSIIFFPEGTRSGGREMGSFHSAAFRLFLESKVPIIPVCISGNEDIPRKGSLLLKEGSVGVRTLPPVLWVDHKDAKPYIIKNLVRERIQGELALMEKKK